jgi:hypothetical protein
MNLLIARSQALAWERRSGGSVSSFVPSEALLLVTRLEPGNADPEALPPFSGRGRASRYGFPGRSWEPVKAEPRNQLTAPFGKRPEVNPPQSKIQNLKSKIAYPPGRK